MRDKIAFYLKLFVGVCILIFLSKITCYLYENTFDTVVTDFYSKIGWQDPIPGYANGAKIHFYFSAFKILLPLLNVLICTRLYIVIARGGYLVTRWFDALFLAIADSIETNYKRLKELPLAIKLPLAAIFTIQFFSLIYFSCSLPYEYDEVYSNIYFSSGGIISSLIYYPVPNNHVLYNIITSIFLQLPIDEILATRLVSVIAGLVGTFYFFKLSRKLLPGNISVLVTALYSFSYPIAYYNTQGRGYSLMVFFAVLAMYSIMCMVEGKSVLKYLAIYTIVSVLAFFTLPSFLYCFVVLNALLLIHFILKWRWKNILGFAGANILIAGLTLLLYTPLILRNTWKALTENNGVIKRDAGYIKANLYNHLNDTWTFFMASSHVGFDWIMMLLGALVLLFFKRGYVNKFFCLLLITMLISPIPIVYLHQTIPFPRTWSYLVIPLSISIGALLYLLSLLVNFIVAKLKVPVLKLPGLILGLTIVVSVIMLSRFLRFHKENAVVDYTTSEYVTILKDKLPFINNFGQGLGDLSFYLAEDLNFEHMRRLSGRKMQWNIVKPNDSPSYDMIVLDKRNLVQPLHLDNYKMVPYDNPFFIVYLRKDI